MQRSTISHSVINLETAHRFRLQDIIILCPISPTAGRRDSSLTTQGSIQPQDGKTKGKETTARTALVTMAPVKYASLVSADGLEFTLPREACLVSPMLKASLESGFSETETGRISLPMLR